MTSKTVAKLRDPKYRKAFVASQINIGIPFQIRGLIQSRGWKQEDLVKRTGMLQPRISALLTPGKVRPNIETLRRIAEAFDCGLEIRFVPFSELVNWSESFNPEHFAVPSFDEEVRQAEEREDAAVAALGIPTEWASVTIETSGVAIDSMDSWAFKPPQGWADYEDIGPAGNVITDLGKSPPSAKFITLEKVA